ncbi:HesB/IscA family protein [Piscirickettsia litoralis]|uniref:Iron-sulfur cluster assembly accessory family protein n=1 Tax=Piscirickettsia litoralis TaxID=1891921 RepID=A0ABX2ZZN9_9GAMM|nr:iron-sulfur cluster assembly accessory protein [Piscirickettsia litoralis]ODN42076.1 iron-sulfur cluster assembly accessory family protein [Piscirickettsia litoralis]
MSEGVVGFDPNEAADIKVTENAAQHFLSVLNKEGAKALRLYIRKSGCSGYRYETDLVDDGKEGDDRLDLESGLTLYIDKTSLPLINGMTIDYVAQPLGQSKVVFHNPREAAVCGCGESFTVTTE